MNKIPMLEQFAAQSLVKHNGELIFSKEKFAQLIVLECMNVFGQDLPEPGGGRMTEVVDRICRVAEHFGVEK